MKIKDLKVILALYPDDTEIYIDSLTDDQYERDNIWVSNVREPYDHAELRNVKDSKIALRPCKETSGAKPCLIL